MEQPIKIKVFQNVYNKIEDACRELNKSHGEVLTEAFQTWNMSRKQIKLIDVYRMMANDSETQKLANL